MILVRLIPDFSCISHTHEGSSMRKSQKDIFETQWAGFMGAKSLNYCYGNGIFLRVPVVFRVDIICFTVGSHEFLLFFRWDMVQF